MAKVGDRFVIEIAEVYEGKDGKKLYRIKGFNSLVFDGRGISMLRCYIDEPEGGYFTGLGKGYEIGVKAGIREGRELERMFQATSKPPEKSCKGLIDGMGEKADEFFGKWCKEKDNETN